MPTIIPLIPETEWLKILPLSPEWNAPMVPTLVLAPHPDDETLGAGGLITRLRSHDLPVTVVAVSDGENAFADTHELGTIRAREQVEAVLRLGVPSSMIHRLGLPDRSISCHEDELLRLLLPLLSEGVHIVAPWPHDFHPDHEAVGRAAARAAESIGASISYYLFWTWHRGKLEVFDGVSLVRLPLNEEEINTKLYALEAHVSQFEHSREEPILTPELLAPARRSFEVYIR